MTSTRINLSPSFFSDREIPLVEHGPLAAVAFRYPSGVCGLRLRTSAASWCCCPSRASRSGRRLSMGAT